MSQKTLEKLLALSSYFPITIYNDEENGIVNVETPHKYYWGDTLEEALDIAIEGLRRK